MTLRLHTFGAVFLERDGAPLSGAHGQRRRLALLAYLAAAGRTAVPRSRLIAMLWPGSDEASARHSLSQMLYSVRHDLGAEVMAVDADAVRLDHAVLTSDVHSFDEAMRRGRFEEASAEYQGDFLAGLRIDDASALNRWIDDERSTRAQACARALDRLAGSAEQAGDHHRALEWLRRRATLDPLDGPTTLRIMRGLVAIGDTDGALRTARVYTALVRDELDVEPDASIAQLEAELKRATPRVPTAPAARAPQAAPPASVPLTSPPSPGQVRRVLPHWRMAAVALVVVAMVIVVRATRSSATSDERATAVVVVGDLEGPDAPLALAVREALRAELVNTSGVRLISDQGIRELKTLMRLPHDSTVQPQQLLQLATRGGAHVAITGSVIPLGAGAQIVLELFDPASQQSIRTFAERPVDAPATLASVGRIARAIGSAISRAPSDTSRRPLPAVTTASLAALKSFALARQTAATGFRREAVAPAERAVAHDSTFVLAHYFLGDLLWFLDEQTHSEAHLTRAYDLLSTVPAREQLVIRARYEQLARDQPDSALVYWQLVIDGSPGDILAYEGRTWALRALGRHEEAAASADTAMSLDPGAILPSLTNATYSWLSVGDTASAISVAARVASRYPAALVEARFYSALFRDPAEAIAWADRTVQPASRYWRRHQAQVAMGDVMGARASLDSVLREDRMQTAPNAMLHQGWLELAARSDTAAAVKYARMTLDWTRRRDLSPPAIGRLSERIADLAARAGDEATVRETMVLVRERDRGRSLRTYVMTLRTLDAALAYVRGDFAEAARLAQRARHGVYFSRSLSTIVQLEAEARRRSGEAMAADSLDHLIETHQIVDGHFEAWAILRAMKRVRMGEGR